LWSFRAPVQENMDFRFLGTKHLKLGSQWRTA
jgi:hypothetical protein